MILAFHNPKHEFLANDHVALSAKYDKKGQIVSEDILEALNVLYAADCLYDVPRSRRPHPLFGTYKGFFAIDVNRKYRNIFRPTNTSDPDYRIDNHKTIRAILIVEIFSDYH